MTEINQESGHKISQNVRLPFYSVNKQQTPGRYIFAGNLPKNYPKSLLRYPGGKNRAVSTIFSLIPKHEKILCSPFLGGGSIELASTTRMIVRAYDLFEPLINFWKVLLKDPKTLAKEVKKYHPLPKERFYSLQKEFSSFTDNLERAAIFYALNRSSFSGTTLSGGMSPGHPRFTESSIERLKNFSVSNFSVECLDFTESIPKNDDAFLYLDPPYLNKQALYGINGNTHIDFNHAKLSEMLSKRDRWILSYNDCPEVRYLYKKYRIIPLEWVYGMSKDKSSNEVVILSNDVKL